MASVGPRLGWICCLMLTAACGDDATGTGTGEGDDSSGPGTGSESGPSSVSLSGTSQGTGGSSGEGTDASSSTAAVDDTSTSTSAEESSSSTGGECEAGCPQDQHCEQGVCAWDQGATIWTATFDSRIPGGVDAANAVAVDGLDQIVVVGGLAVPDGMGGAIPDAYDVVIRKYDADGGLLWSQTRPQGLGVDVTTNGADEALVAIGSFGPGAESAALYAPDGTAQWALTGTGAIADGIEIGAGGSYFVVGWVPGADPIPWAAQYTPAGGLLWQGDYSGQIGRDRRVVLDPSGTSLAMVGSNVVDQGGSDLIEEWLQVWPVDPGTGSPGPSPAVDQHSVSGMDVQAAFANGIAFMADGDMVVVGNELTPAESWNITLSRYAPDGSLVWRETYDNPASTGDGGFDVAVDSAQNIVIVGAHDRVDLMEGENALVRKYDADGVLLWERQHDEAMLGDRANGVAIDSQDAIVVAGTVDAGDGSGPALWVRKYAP